MRAGVVLRNVDDAVDLAGMQLLISRSVHVFILSQSRVLVEVLR